MTVETFARRLHKLLLAQAACCAETAETSLPHVGKPPREVVIGLHLRAQVYRQVAEIVLMAASDHEVP